MLGRLSFEPEGGAGKQHLSALSRGRQSDSNGTFLSQQQQGQEQRQRHQRIERHGGRPVNRSGGRRDSNGSSNASIQSGAGGAGAMPSTPSSAASLDSFGNSQAGGSSKGPYGSEASVGSAAGTSSFVGLSPFSVKSSSSKHSMYTHKTAGSAASLGAVSVGAGSSTSSISGSYLGHKRSSSSSLQHRRSGSSSSSSMHELLPAANRVKVAVRCRPPFEDEGAVPAVTVAPPLADQVLSRSLQIEVGPGKRKEFNFDVVFGPGSSNSDVYNTIGGPVVDGVLKGINGTILAYGQTGSGKTFSLGILTRVTGETGIIPRSLSHIFGAIGIARAQGSAAQYAVTMSFCQIYLDTVQDLLVATASNSAAAIAALSQGASGSGAAAGAAAGAVPGVRNGNAAVSSAAAPSLPSNAAGGNNSNNLQVREDPAKGFYVEGLSEYSVHSFDDACALLNWGLENRVLGATRANATSSRSHTILTVRLETRQPVSMQQQQQQQGGREGDDVSAAAPAAAAAAAAAGVGGLVGTYISQRSQLMLCDLAGSERVRQTSSKGTRLEEARAINGSLHTLGQVISALSVLSSSSAGQVAGRVHVPWRDSKLTRLLHGNLGGNANTFLLGTVGPGVRNASESFSTLLFASRCMRVSSTPVVATGLTSAAAAGEFADLCAKLQARLGSLEAGHAQELAAVTARYDVALREMQTALQAAQADAGERTAALEAALSKVREEQQKKQGLEGRMRLADLSLTDSLMEESLLIAGDAAAGGGAGDMPASLSAAALKPLFLFLCRSCDSTVASLASLALRAQRHRRAWDRAIQRAAAEEKAGKAALERSSSSSSSSQHAEQEEHHGAASAAAADAAANASKESVAAAVTASSLQRVHLQYNFDSAGQRSSLPSIPAAASLSPFSLWALTGSLPSNSQLSTGLQGTSALEDKGKEEGSAAAAGAAGGTAPEVQASAGEGGAESATPLAFTALAAAQAHLCEESVALQVLQAFLQKPDLPRASPHSATDTKASEGEADKDGQGQEKEPAACILVLHPDVTSFRDYGSLAAYCQELMQCITSNCSRLDELCQGREGRFDDLKRHLAAAEAAVKLRDEDAAHQRVVLKYLLDTSASLRKELKKWKRVAIGSGEAVTLALLEEQEEMERKQQQQQQQGRSGSAAGAHTAEALDAHTGSDEDAEGLATDSLLREIALATQTPGASPHSKLLQKLQQLQEASNDKHTAAGEKSAGHLVPRQDKEQRHGLSPSKSSGSGSGSSSSPQDGAGKARSPSHNRQELQGSSRLQFSFSAAAGGEDGDGDIDGSSSSPSSAFAPRPGQVVVVDLSSPVKAWPTLPGREEGSEEEQRSGEQQGSSGLALAAPSAGAGGALSTSAVATAAAASAPGRPPRPPPKHPQGKTAASGGSSSSGAGSFISSTPATEVPGIRVNFAPASASDSAAEGEDSTGFEAEGAGAVLHDDDDDDMASVGSFDEEQALRELSVLPMQLQIAVLRQIETLAADSDPLLQQELRTLLPALLGPAPDHASGTASAPVSSSSSSSTGSSSSSSRSRGAARLLARLAVPSPILEEAEEEEEEEEEGVEDGGDADDSNFLAVSRVSRGSKGAGDSKGDTWRSLGGLAAAAEAEEEELELQLDESDVLEADRAAGAAGAVQDDDEDLGSDADAEGEGDDIEAIVAHRYLQPQSNSSGSSAVRLVYKVHWKDSSPEEDEWFAREDLLADFPEAVLAYEKANGIRL